jgi:hypothetical protein
MSTNNYAFILFLSIMLWSCSNTQPQQQNSSDEHVMIYQELLEMEHALLSSKKDIAIDHSDNLDEILRNGYNLFCPTESSKIDGVRMTNFLLKQNIENKTTSDLLDDLRLLKATIINLETDDDYDPYFAYLWRFEEEMYATTHVAIDPMLDLQEWNEFDYMVDCMNDAWYPVKLHAPSSEILDHDPEKFKNQTVHKIYLDNAVEHFNKAVKSADYEKYPLCESAEAVREAYIKYVKTFIQQSGNTDFMLAKM